MAGGGDKGLASSRWAPMNTGRPPYHFKKSTLSSTTPTTPTTAASIATTSASSSSSDNNSSPITPSHAASTPASTSTGGGGETTTTTNTTTTTTSSPTLTGHDSDINQADLLAAALNRIPTPWAELGRFTKIARRLKWKLPFLAHGYNMATSSSAGGVGIVAGVVNNDDDNNLALRAEAELMFKLDFFEYYMLLERALVHLMGVFGIRVTGGFHHHGGAMANKNGNGNGSGGEKRSDHRFHANVLEALDDVRNPLNESLGKDEVRYALARAKELRNRWKNADDPDASLIAARTARTRPLADYDLERILETIFAGFDAGFLVAQRYVNEVRALAAAQQNKNNNGGAGVYSPGGGNDIDMDAAGLGDEEEEGEGEWGFMTDAMDWQAV